MHGIEFTPEALDDLLTFRPFGRRIIVAEIEAQLSHEPARETRNWKRLRPNRLAEWELRAGAFRIFYYVEPGRGVVKIVAVGYKTGKELFIHGQRYRI